VDVDLATLLGVATRSGTVWQLASICRIGFDSGFIWLAFAPFGQGRRDGLASDVWRKLGLAAARGCLYSHRSRKIRLVMETVSPKIVIPLRMKSKFLESAQQRIPNPELLVNVVSRRVRQLAQGHRPITQTDARMDFAEVALKEISEGKLTFEVISDTELVPEVAVSIPE
jgi:DNA-directed RNA polymerase subunit omega